MEIDLLAYLISLKPEVQNKTSRGSVKLQLTAELKLMKSRVDEEDDEQKTDMKTVYYDCLSEDEFFPMVQQIICVLNCFSSIGSRWVLEKLNKLNINFVKFNPIRGSSHLALPSELVNNRHLLNIRNINDSNCFFYCYTAAYHMKYGPC